MLKTETCDRRRFLGRGGMAIAAASGDGYRRQFSGPYAHRILPGIGHNVPQEASEAFAQAIIDFDRL